MLLKDLIKGTRCTPRAGTRLSARITDIAEDSRTCVPGSLFIAKRGTALDGAAFIHDAIEHGAEAILIDARTDADHVPAHIAALITDDVPRTGARLAERFFGDPSGDLYVAGVTGTNAKTTVTTLAHAMLNHAGVRTGLIGTVTIDDGREIGAASLTTPPATEISRTLATMREHQCIAAMLECSSHALHQGRTSAVRFDCAVFTNLSGDHLDYHGTLDAYADAKALLFEQLGAGLAIVNADDPFSSRMLEACPEAEVLRFAPAGSSAPGDARLSVIHADLVAQRLELIGPWGSAEGVLRAPGAHNATNALAAACVCWHAGLDADAIAGALEHARMPEGRVQRVSTGADGEPTVFVDFAHTDEALAMTLRALRGAMADDQRLICVFGCGGDRDRTKRPRMGQAACTHADVVVLTSDNPRTETPQAIIEDVLAGLNERQRARVEVHADRARAIDEAIALARPRDVVLIAGKGHEREQLLPDGAGGIRRTAFDDRQHALAVLTRRAGGASR
ncbi:MAG: hypothetical protein Tsb0013_14320 [Phycisphaerales bacterium]